MAIGRLPLVDGEVYCSSRKLGSFYMIVGLCLAGLGAYLIFIAEVVGGAIAIAAGVVSIWLLALPLLMGRRRLIIGDESFQLVERADQVLIQLPYANIAELHLNEAARSTGASYVGVWVRRKDGRGSFFKPGFDSPWGPDEFDVVLTDDYTVPIKRIYDRLYARWQAVGMRPARRR